MKRIIACLSLLLLSSACHKYNNPDPSPLPGTTATTGSISGNYSPGTAVILRLHALSPVNGQSGSYLPVIDARGNFNFANLPPGTYTLQIISPDPSYAAPAGQTLTVTAGKDTGAGTIVLAASPNLGSISGTVVPAGAATQVIIALPGSNPPTATAAVDPQTGKFSISGIPAGMHAVTFIPADKFTPPAIPPVVTVTPGQNSDAGTASFTSYGRIAALAFTLNGTAAPTWSGQTTYLANTLTLTATRSEGPFFTGYRTDRLVIKLDNLTAPGTYICSPGTVSALSYSWSNPDGSGGGAGWTSLKTGSTATVVITALDPGSGTVSGTFTASLLPNTGLSSPAQLITGGTFTTTYK